MGTDKIAAIRLCVGCEPEIEYRTNQPGRDLAVWFTDPFISDSGGPLRVAIFAINPTADPPLPLPLLGEVWELR